MTSETRYSRPPTAQRAALDELRHWLLSGRLAPGDRVRQDEAAHELDTSVIPVREALKILESEGQVVYIPHRGFFVAELSRDELIELCEIRSALESMSVRRNIELLGPDDFDAMRSLIEQMERADADVDIVAMVRLDRAFHFRLFDAAGATQLARVIKSTWDQSDPYRAAFFADEEHRASNHDEHRAILAAIEERDPERVIELLDAHRLTPVETLDHLRRGAPTESPS